VRDFNPDQTISNVAPVRTLVQKRLTQPQLYLTLFSLFALLALLLAAIGIYGLVGYSVAQRTREFGLRLALGAQRFDIFSLIVGHGFRLVLVGVAVGLAGAIGATRLLSSLLFATSVTDPVAFASVALLLVLVALLASYLPARRAMKIDPMEALRYE
jgi:putative ABC transport system permease protein